MTMHTDAARVMTTDDPLLRNAGESPVGGSVSHDITSVATVRYIQIDSRS
jgi:hypothetical protein